MSRALVALGVSAWAAFGCHASPLVAERAEIEAVASRTAEIEETRAQPRRWLCVEIQPSRHLVCREAARAQSTLLRFLDSLGSAARTDATRGVAEIEEKPYRHVTLRWKVEGDELCVVAQEPTSSSCYGGFAAELLYTLAFHLRLDGIVNTPGAFSGLLVGKEIDSGSALTEVDRVFRARGFLPGEVFVGQEWNAQEYESPVDHSAAFRVDIYFYAGRNVQIAVTNLAAPFDGDTEESVLREALAKLTDRPIAYGRQFSEEDGYIVITTR